jgi:CubicO group peptidase (beta-lactamase class C family)
VTESFDKTWSRLPKARAAIERGMAEGLHIGAQLYVSLRGEIISDAAMGESRAGVPMTPDTLMLWLSATKPTIAVCIGQLCEKKLLAWDDPVTRFIPEFAQWGKSAITLRHLLTHTGGFRAADRYDHGTDSALILSQICQTRPEYGWIPGGKAGYHKASSWYVLGEIIRRVDGRPPGQYAREELFLPCGMNDAWIGIPHEQARAYGKRLGLLHVTAKGWPELYPGEGTPEGFEICKPGSHGRGPMHDLGRFYEHLLKLRMGESSAKPILQPSTVLEMTRRQREGMFDHTFQHKVDWGLGIAVDSNRYGVDTIPYGFGRHCSDTTFGHGGSQSSCAFADPAHGLVAAWVLNGLPGEEAHQPRVRAINAAIYEDLGLVRG